MSSRNPLARSAGGNLVGDVVLPPDTDGSRFTLRPDVFPSAPPTNIAATTTEDTRPETVGMEAALVLLLVGFGVEASPRHGFG
jgi:hypothetical protein